jgi:hypothetical protein
VWWDSIIFAAIRITLIGEDGATGTANGDIHHHVPPD